MMTTAATDALRNRATRTILTAMAELSRAGLTLPTSEPGVATFAVASPEVESNNALPDLAPCLCTAVLFVELRWLPTKPSKATLANEADSFSRGSPRATTVELLAIARQNGLLGDDE